MNAALSVLAALALQSGAADLSGADLAGTWDVALHFSAEAPPSKTAMVIEPAEDGALLGGFYGSSFIEARAAARGGAVAFTATTEDGSGAYIHSGRLTASGVIAGQTLSVGRDFLMLWTAERREETPR